MNDVVLRGAAVPLLPAVARCRRDVVVVKLEVV